MVLIVTIKMVSAKMLAVWNPVKSLVSNEEFGLQEGRAGTPLLLITISPITPSSLCLIPSSATGEPSCSFMAQRCHVVRIIFQSLCSD